MPDDPLVTALHHRRLLTPFDLEAAIRYRQARIRDLQEEVASLRALHTTYDDILALRAERDPPLETAEHSHY